MIVMFIARGGTVEAEDTAAVPPVPPPPLTISAVFTPEVQYWGSRILAWAAQYGVDPNMLATVMQIESCGDPTVGSNAGAQGLFQVMPFHFSEGEDMHDPDTNARRGIEYLRGSLERADGHIGLALAGYNGGWGVIEWGWGRWPTQTRLYYLWGTQIYLDALNGKTLQQSDALQSWLNAGGARLCAQANAVLFPPTPAPSPVATTPAPVQPGITPTLFIVPTS